MLKPGNATEGVNGSPDNEILGLPSLVTNVPRPWATPFPYLWQEQVGLFPLQGLLHSERKHVVSTYCVQGKMN